MAVRQGDQDRPGVAVTPEQGRPAPPGAQPANVIGPRQMTGANFKDFPRLVQHMTEPYGAPGLKQAMSPLQKQFGADRTKAREGGVTPTERQGLRGERQQMREYRQAYIRDYHNYLSGLMSWIQQLLAGKTMEGYPAFQAPKAPTLGGTSG